MGRPLLQNMESEIAVLMKEVQRCVGQDVFIRKGDLIGRYGQIQTIDWRDDALMVRVAPYFVYYGDPDEVNNNERSWRWLPLDYIEIDHFAQLKWESPLDSTDSSDL